jgi:5-methylcytosine-specific restriction enzyme subunit McrC
MINFLQKCEYCYKEPIDKEMLCIETDEEYKVFLDGLEDYLKKQNLSNALLFTKDGIVTQNYVGVIKFKKFQLDILPKLLSKSENIKDNGQYIVKNLIYMISLTQKLDIKMTEHADINHCENPFLEVLIREYAISLFECLKRLTPRNYIREEDNLNYLKGKLKFTENIRYNCANQAKFYCEYDEFSENNKLNQLFLFVSKCLFNISSSSENRKILSFIMNYFCDLPLVRYDKYKADKIILTRNQQLFSHPFKIAKMFLENISVDISKNSIENITLLWDMNLLFEEFVYEIIKRHVTGYTPHYQKNKKLLRNADNLKEYGNTFVDVYLQKNDNKDKIILDTKYKINSGGNSEFLNTDIYQVCTYCLLHNTDKAILFYPADIDFRSNKDIKDKYFVVPKIPKFELNSDNSDILIHRIMIQLNQDLTKISDHINEFTEILHNHVLN